MGLNLSTFFHVLDFGFEPVTQESTNSTGHLSLQPDQVASTSSCISTQTDTLESEDVRAYVVEAEDTRVFATREEAQAFAQHDGAQVFTPEGEGAQAAFAPHEGAQASTPEGAQAASVTQERAQASAPEEEDPRVFAPERWDAEEEQQNYAGELGPEPAQGVPRYHAIMCNADDDGETAWRITQHLENRYGLRIFYPPRDLLLGGDYCTVIGQSVLACDVAICLATPNTPACGIYDFTVNFACFHSIGASNRRSLIVIRMAEDAPIQTAVQPLYFMNYFDSHRRRFFWDNLACSIRRETSRAYAVAACPQSAHPEATSSEATPHEDARHEATRHEDARHEATRRESTRHDATSSEATRHDAARHEATRHEATRHEDARHEATRHEDARHEATSSEATRHEDTRYNATRYEAARHEDTRREDTRHEDARHESTRHDATSSEATRHDAARLEATRREDTRHEDARHEDARHEDTHREVTRLEDTRPEGHECESDVYLAEDNTAVRSLPAPRFTVPVSESQVEADMEAYRQSATASIVANSEPATPTGPDSQRVCMFTDPLSSMVANAGSLNKN